MNRDFVTTRSAGLERLAEMVPGCGLDYAARRNLDTGPLGEATTTGLSPYLRRRLLLEQEVVAAALAKHGAGKATKFVEEVFWRSYFKGFLETHPGIWTNYLDLVAQAKDASGTSSGGRRAYEAAVAGRTGIDGFDDWSRELVETGWLHNHVRMWFASIWIFTLGLPWALGADFFLRHLVDGDPASNTLSWRWVAGLHTRGKPYAARAENIRRYTDGRYSPTGLNENPIALQEDEYEPAITPGGVGECPTGEVALLLHLDDLHPESLPLGSARVVRLGGLVAHAPDATERVRRADEDAMADGLARAAAYFDCPATQVDAGWAGTLPVVTAWAPVGPSADALPAGVSRVRRQWDDLTWPRATRGYFQMKTAIPAILDKALQP